MSRGKERFRVFRRSMIDAVRRGEHVECGICRKPILYVFDMSIDHIIPKSRGGLNEWWNFQASHKACNTKKSDKMPGKPITKKVLISSLFEEES